MLAFRARAALELEPTRISAPPPSRKERLAIVASGGKPCGIASYAAALTGQLAEAFDVTLFSLDQYLMRNTHRRVRPRADREVHEIARAIAGFDAVNLQLEHGTLGGHGIDIYRRFCWIAAAAPRLSVTFHTLLKPVPTNLGGFGRALLTLDFATAGRIRRDFRRNRLLSVGIPRQLRQLQRHKHVSAVVHNRRDLYDAKYLYGLDNVFDHPLSFLNADEIDRVRADGAHHRFPIAERLPADAVLVGVFGFLNEYKGFGTAIRALHHLPKNYHLLIFGGTHPNEIAARRPVHPYIASLFDDAFTDTSLYERLRASGESIRPGLVLNADRSLGELLGTHPRDLSTRIHFMGALGDADFLAGMAACDAVVFPYQEVGQSSSGPISQALELGCRILAARTHAFLGFGEYHKQAVEFFDIGNHLELADRLRAARQFPTRTGLPEYNVETNKAVYLVANSALTRRPAPLPVGDTRAEAEPQQS